MSDYKMTVIPLYDDPGGMTASPGEPWAEITGPDLVPIFTEAGEKVGKRMPKTSKLRPCALDVRVQVPE